VQEGEKAKLGEVWDASSDLVFPNAIGGLMIPKNFVKRHFKRKLQAAGLPEIRFHDLRHTAATLMLSRGVNVKVVSEMLGHADISITLRIYAHVLPHMQHSAVQAMEALLGFEDDTQGSEQEKAPDKPSDADEE
jgi:integrase